MPSDNYRIQQDKKLNIYSRNIFVVIPTNLSGSVGTVENSRNKQ